MMLEVSGLTKRYSSKSAHSAVHAPAIDDVSFEVGEGELFTLLGPSGCGKTTTLRSIAGLEDPDEGRIRLRSRLLFDSKSRVNVPCNARGLAMVFQSYAIWPHMTVFKNVAFPIESLPRRERPSAPVIRERVDRALAVVGLLDYRDRQSTTLSGGQQQRLALARALAAEPSVILLDEPLSNLDPKLRANLRLELKRLQRDANVTAVYVTHDQAEALSLSSHVAVMNLGRVMQIGKPREIYGAPRNRFVADFLGSANFADGVIVDRGGGWLTVKTDIGILKSANFSQHLSPAAAAVCTCIRPEHMELTGEPGASSQENQLEGKVLTTAFLGDTLDALVDIAGTEFRVRCSPDVSVRRSDPVWLHVRPEHVLLLPRE